MDAKGSYVASRLVGLAGSIKSRHHGFCFSVPISPPLCFSAQTEKIAFKSFGFRHVLELAPRNVERTTPNQIQAMIATAHIQNAIQNAMAVSITFPLYDIITPPVDVFAGYGSGAAIAAVLVWTLIKTSITGMRTQPRSAAERPHRTLPKVLAGGSHLLCSSGPHTVLVNLCLLTSPLQAAVVPAIPQQKKGFCYEQRDLFSSLEVAPNYSSP